MTMELGTVSGTMPLDFTVRGRTDCASNGSVADNRSPTPGESATAVVRSTPESAGGSNSAFRIVHPKNGNGSNRGDGKTNF